MKIKEKNFPRLLAAKIYVRYQEDKIWREQMISSIEPYRFSVWECGFLTQKQCEKLDPVGAGIMTEARPRKRYVNIMKELEHMFSTKAHNR